MLKKVLLLFLLILLITLVPDVIYYGKSYLQITNFQTYDSNLEIDKENNLYFKNSKGEVVFTIPAPVMTDAKGEISYNIDVKVKNLKKETEYFVKK